MLLGGPGPDGSDPGFQTQGAIFYEVRGAVGQKSNGMLEQVFCAPSMAVLNAAADGSLYGHRPAAGTPAVRRRRRLRRRPGRLETRSGTPANSSANPRRVLVTPGSGSACEKIGQVLLRMETAGRAARRHT